MNTRTIRAVSSIGNAASSAPGIARTPGISGTAPDTSGKPDGLPGSNADADFCPRPLDGVPGGFLTANGQRDSHAVTLADGQANGSPRAGTPYRRVSWAEIVSLAKSPAKRTKDRAQLVILSTYAECDGRTHEIQRQRGQFGGLAVDIDSGNPSLEHVLAAVRSAVGDVEAVIYSSSSAKPDARKWRILFPLALALPGADYADTQTALFGLLQAEGLECDPALARAAQPVFLPNVPPDKRDELTLPLFYQWQHLAGPRLELVTGSPIVEARESLREKRQADELEQATKAAEYRERKLAHVAATGDTFDPIEHFKANHSVADLLARYGFEKSPKGRGSHWRSPLSASGSYSTEDRGDHWVTVSAWAHNHNVGRTSRNGHRYGDAFDLYAYFEHNGDRSAAVRTYADQVRPRKSGGYLAKLPAVRVEHREAALESIPIDQYRRDLAQAVAEAVLDGSPGVKLLRGAPGCGKTTAVAKAVAKFRRGIVSVPGHELAGEIVEKLREAGADAAAYPRLDETTCGYFETAARARAAGLSVPATVCPKCPLLKQCRESGYLSGVAAAEKAAHKVVTHARLQRSAARLTKEAEYVVLEEDPTTALRPTTTATRRELRRIAELADALADAETRCLILEGLEPSPTAVEPVAEFAEWAPVHSAQSQQSAGTPPMGVCPAGGTNGTNARSARSYPRGFFGSLCRIADELHDELARAVLEQRQAGVVEISVEPVRDLPKNPEGTVWHGLEMIARIDPDATAGISPEAMRLVIAAATGRIQKLYAQTEVDARQGAGGKRSATVVGVSITHLPWLEMPVFVNDGTLDVETLRRITCSHSDFHDMVCDITPSGSAPLLHESRQYPLDVLPSTSTSKVAAIVSGIIRANESRERVGLVLHQRHYRELLEHDDSPLPADVRSRIAWATYFGSGADRGTNTLHRVCDLAVVVGTFRPPPSEIRRTLVRWGDIAAASSSPTWGRIDRHADGADGAELAYHGRGYAELEWARAADACTRAAMRQAIGRARAICPDGVPVIAVTTESTGLPIASPEELPVADLRLDALLGALGQAVADGVKMGNPEPAGAAEYRAENPIYLLGKSARFSPGGSVPLEELEKRLPGVSSRSLQVWLREAIDAGLVVRTGAARATRYALAAVGPAPAPAVVAVTVAPPSSPTVDVEPVRPLVAYTVPEKPAPAPDWLRQAVAPERHPDEILRLKFLLAGPYAKSVGQANVWAAEVTPSLVPKLHTVSSIEAKRRGQPPPPIDVVARHTSAWFAVAAAG